MDANTKAAAAETLTYAEARTLVGRLDTASLGRLLRAAERETSMRETAHAACTILNDEVP